MLKAKRNAHTREMNQGSLRALHSEMSGQDEHAHQTVTRWLVLNVIAGAVVTVVSCSQWEVRTEWGPPASVSSQIESNSADPSTRMVKVPVGARMTCPPGWEPTTTPDFELMLVPTEAPRQPGSDETNLRWGEHFISLDIPKLPTFRIPGFLPMDRIRGGYLDHLRKQVPEARVEDLKSPPIPDANAALVRTAWPGDHPTHVETALILPHADRVYILRGRSRTEDEHTTRDAFDQLVQSLRWGEN